MEIVNKVKIEVVKSVISKMSAKEIVDLITDYSKREFGEYEDKFNEAVSHKLIDIVKELNRR